jgi:hypothetical protein
VCSIAADDALAALEAALDAVAAEGSPFDDAGRLERVRRLTAAANRITALQAHAVRDAEVHQAAEHDGLKTMKSWLRTHARLSGAAITGLIKQGRAMAHLPAVEAAFLTGRLTPDQVDTIAVIIAPEHLGRAIAQQIDLAAIEHALIDVATSQPYAKLCTAVGHYLNRLDPDGREPDPTEQRSLTLVQHPDGTVTGGLALDQHGGETVMTALEAAAAKSRSAGDTRTRDQRIADALVQVCANFLATGDAPRIRTNPAQLLVMVDERKLTAPGNDPAAAISGTGAAVSSTRARRIACDSQVNRIVFDADSVPINFGRTRRVVSPAQRRALDARDRSCVFAGCQSTQLVVRSPPHPGMDNPERTHRPGQPRPALRTPPHQGPPRLRRRTTNRRHLAHLPTRRHRDHRRHTPAHRLTGHVS